MKQNRLRNGILSGVGALLVAVLVLASVLAGAPETAADTGFATLSDVSGKLHFGTVAIHDPVRVSTAQYSYFAPSTYVYFGGTADEPLLFRVLDADADNTGASGAMFLFAEDTSAWGEERYSLYEADFDYTKLENIYQHSYLRAYAVKDAPFKNSSRPSGETAKAEIPTELDFVRAVTKQDSTEAMYGLYGYDTDGSYWWYAPDEEEFAENLSFLTYYPTLYRETVFPLSVEELATYISAHNGAPGLASDDGATYWTRTSLNDQSGNLVGAVNRGGFVEARSVYAGGSARYGLNVKTDQIVFTRRVGTHDGAPIYQIAMQYPAYASTSTPFEAEVYNVEDGILTVKYDNVIYPPTGSITQEEKNYISVMITDERGVVTYYGSIKELGSSHPSGRTGIVAGDWGLAHVTLPADFDSENHHVSVFLERKMSDRSVSYVSNSVTLDCIHEVGEAANCQRGNVCANCGVMYGSINPEVHALLGEYFIDEIAHTHEQNCAFCDVSTGKVACTYGNTCLEPCVCGSTSGMKAEAHAFDDNGICLHDASHTEGFVGDGEGFQNIEIYNEGQFLSFAKYVNAGGRVNRVYLMADLDFTGIDFIPVGTENVAFDGMSFDGYGHTVRGIHHSDPDGISALFANVRGTSIGELILCESSFEGRIAASLIGKATRVSNVRWMQVTDVSVTGSQTAGAVVAVAEGSALRATGAYHVTAKDGTFLPFTGEGNARGGGSWVEADVTNVEIGAWSESDIRSGALAYALGESIDGAGARVYQTLGTHAYPYYKLRGGESDKRVYGTQTCEGDYVYTNDRSALTAIGAHTYARPATDPVEFIWDDFFAGACTVDVVCGDCGHVERIDADVDAAYYTTDMDDINGIIRVDYTPSVTVGGQTYTGEMKVHFSVKLEDVIAMTPVETVWDGTSFSPSDFMDNHRLVPEDMPMGYWQYEAWFVNQATGEKLWHEAQGSWDYSYALSADAVGVYDLVVMGKNEFIGQSVTYESVLTIKEAHVTLAPQDVYKAFDGGKSFEALYTVVGEDYDGYAYDWFDVRLSDASASAVGTYELSVSATVKKAYAGNVVVTLTKDTVKGAILPAFAKTIEEVTYPDENLTYGDAIPVPTAEHFGFVGEIDYAWYALDGDRRVLVDAPKNAGDYLLCVLLPPADGYAVATYYEHPVWIKPRTPAVELILPDGATLAENHLTVKGGESLSVALSGLAEGDRAEDFAVEMTVDGYSVDRLPDAPREDGYAYDLFLHVYYDGRVGGAENYEHVYFYLSLEVLPDATEAPAPTLPYLALDASDRRSDGETTFDLTVYWNFDYFNGETPRYTVTLYDGTDAEIESVSADYAFDFGEDIASHTFTLDRAGEYRIEVSYVLYSDTSVRGVQESLSFTVGMTRDGAAVDRIDGMGAYVLTLTQGTESESVSFKVRQRIVMLLKAIEINLSDGVIPYARENVVTTAESTFARGHELVSVTVDAYAGRGEAWISSIKVIDTATGKDVSDLYEVDSYVSDWSHTESKYNVAHVFNSACDDTCAYCEYTRAASHVKGEAANCIRGAICAECFEVYTAREPNRHVHTTTSLYPHLDDLDVHASVYTCCGAVVSLHEHTLSAATCVEGATCTECHWVTGKTDPDNHVSDPTYKAHQSDPNLHVITHPCCGASGTEAHADGTPTCKGILCAGCATYYGEIDPTVHAEKGTYVADGEVHHAVYACCGVSATEEHTGGTASCTDRAKCDLCGGAYGTVDPEAHTSTDTKIVLGATNASVHEERHVCCDGLIRSEFHKGGTANCATAAICEVCASEYGVKDPHNHASEEMRAVASTVAGHHDVVRSCCGEVVKTEAHTGGTSTCTAGATCTACGTIYAEPIAHTYKGVCDAICDVCLKQTRPAALHTDATADSICDVCGAEIPVPEAPEAPEDGESGEESTTETVMTVVGFACAGATVAGAGGFSLWWFAFQKKSWWELLRIVRK